MNYKIIRSGRKTLAVQVTRDGVIVRAPYRMSEGEINRFVSEHQNWIQKHQEKLALELSDRPAVERLTDQDIQALADEALKVIPERVRYYATLVGVTYGRITIRNQKSRWGSCSSKGNLNFNCLLMLTPPEVIDSVVVHELCHRKEMNHSAAFYREVYRVYPEYDKWNRWLKKNGPALMRRMTG
ncbi:MAG: M48 family metallopeptidase [Lachnospiraceae bacterium]|nr:M48 family metallopeptidase [Lachnospiraceae bacterium]